MDVDVAIIGAGPFGLSSGAWLKNKGRSVGIFGDPMSFWRDHMPAGMYLRSNWAASHISDPSTKLTLDHFKADTGAKFGQPIPLQNFVQYGEWYQKKALPELQRTEVRNVEKNGNGFKVSLDNGSQLKARRVIVATGIAHFPWMPREFEGNPKSHVTHTSDHSDLSRFRGKRIAVIGSGQSALDAARILKAFEADVEVIGRQKEIRWVGQNAWLHKLGPISWCLYSNFDVGPAGLSRLVGFPNLFRKLPRSLQDPLSHRATRPAGTGWQKPQLQAVSMTLDRLVTSVDLQGDTVKLKLSDSTERLVDHVIVATGYRADVSRYKFLDASISQALRTSAGSPVLTRALESSVPGLHFAGKPAAWSFGPLLNFISGTHFAAAELLKAF
ncbi:NAD(P)-binding domain-containing protein [Occallatibacter savannae]|uniref:NAD(P)-binding domain-containing protein n=1 Tax=Occallatibacter savannae TaxID=1002691 RepID=UPI000D68BEC2|nr:NAD(P)-binding domain-containing protein [Occallatibacter savannae]